RGAVPPRRGDRRPLDLGARPGGAVAQLWQYEDERSRPPLRLRVPESLGGPDAAAATRGAVLRQLSQERPFLRDEGGSGDARRPGALRRDRFEARPGHQAATLRPRPGRLLRRRRAGAGRAHARATYSRAPTARRPAARRPVLAVSTLG